jgi:hypothetical protein
MATTIKLKNSVTTTAAPSSLVQGEVATNITDKKVWVGDASSTPVQILGAGATVSGTTGTFSGAVSATGGFSGALNGTVGATTPAAGAFTTVAASGDVTLSGTGQIKLPVGTTAQRSGSPVNGMLRYNSSLASFEGYVDGAWGGVGGAQAGGAIYENSQTISASYTLTTNKNGLSAGPLSIADGITVTIPNGSTWVIL